MRIIQGLWFRMNCLLGILILFQSCSKKQDGLTNSSVYTIRSQSELELIGVYPANDFGFFVVARTRESGNMDGVVFRFDNTCKLIWEKKVGSAFDEKISSAVITRNDDILLLGRTNGSDVKLDSLNFFLDYSNVYLCKLNKDGTELWERYMNPTGIGYNTLTTIYDAIETSNGDFALCGSHYMEINPSIYKPNAFSIRMNADGNNIKINLFDSVSYFYKVDETSDNHLVFLMENSSYLPDFSGAMVYGVNQPEGWNKNGQKIIMPYFKAGVIAKSKPDNNNKWLVINITPGNTEYSEMNFDLQAKSVKINDYAMPDVNYLGINSQESDFLNIYSNGRSLLRYNYKSRSSVFRVPCGFPLYNITRLNNGRFVLSSSEKNEITLLFLDEQAKILKP